MVRILAILAIGMASISAAAGGTADAVAPMALKAMERGHGQTCSLAMVPVASGGYYPCLDFGPYRIVKQYGRITGYVVREGKAPFLVYLTENGEGGFTVRGPWETDMAAKMALFWNDVIEGRGAEMKARQERESERQAAEAYISGLNAKPNPQAVPEADKPDAKASPVRNPAAGGGIREVISGTTP